MEYTSNTKMFSSVIDSEEDLEILTPKFLKKISGCMASNFKKIGMNNDKQTNAMKTDCTAR